MSNEKQTVFGAWLDASLHDARSRPAAARLATACGSPAQGDGALLVFSLARTALAKLDADPKGPAAEWARLAGTVARDGLLVGAAHSQIQEGTRRNRRMKVWGPMLRMADLHATDDLCHGSLLAIGLVLASGLCSEVGLSKKIADQLSGMAGACLSGSGHSYAHEWVAFSELNLLDVEALQQVVDGGAPEQIRSLASRLRKAVERLPSLPSPGTIRPAQAMSAASPPAGPLPLSAAARKPVARGSHPPFERKLVASVIGISKAASYAGTAEVFGVPDTWNRYAPQRLVHVTGAIGEALGPSRLGMTRGFALLSLMAMVVSHDHRPSLKLRIGLKPGEIKDLWYCPVSRCAFADRRLLLRLETDDGTPDLIPLFVPGDAADEIERLLRLTPGARDFVELIGVGDLDEWLSLAESWLAGLGDPAHKSRSARVSHALGLVYRAVGASEAEAALLTLNLALAPDGALNYIAIEPARAYELACRVFDFLQLQRPAPPPEGMRIGSRDVPTCQELRDDWEGLSETAADDLRCLRVADSLEALKTRFNGVMVAARRAYESLYGARHESMGMPRAMDLLASDQEAFTDDKNTRPSSARLLPMTLSASYSLNRWWPALALGDRARALIDATYACL